MGHFSSSDGKSKIPTGFLELAATHGLSAARLPYTKHPLQGL